MTPKQLSEVIIGIAEVQAAVVTAVSELVEPGRVVSELKQKLGNALLAHSGGHAAKSEFRTLCAKALQAKLAPGSHADRTLEQTLEEDIARLLK